MVKSTQPVLAAEEEEEWTAQSIPLLTFSLHHPLFPLCACLLG